MSSSPNIYKSSLPGTPSKSIPQLLQQLQHPRAPASKLKPSKPELDINMIRSQMRKKWRDAGYTNSEFSKPSILRGKVLTDWQYDRIYQAERSYKVPKGYKGIKFDAQSRQFVQPSRDTFPAKFQAYLDRVNARYEDRLFEPDRSIEQKGDKIRKMITENSIRAASPKQFHKTGLFGYSSTRKYKTIGSMQ